MEKSVVVLLGVALGAAALAAFGLYRWRQRARARRVDTWVRDYLCRRYGGPPGGLKIHCSDDTLWPVLVAFDSRQTGARHSLRFACAGPSSTFFLLSETEEKR